MLWAALLIGSAVFLGALARTPAAASAWLRLRQALGVFLLIYGSLLIVGASSGATDVFAPLETWTRTRSESAPELNFVPVKTLADLDRAVSRAQQEGRVAMLDVYADWCVECKHLERETFVEASVHRRLSNMLLLRADVTANDDEDRALLSSHALYGPPALLFFREGDELRQQRVVGFVAAPAFAQLLDTLAVR
jgi:thiol:disulfide interchange protein DsbD